MLTKVPFRNILLEKKLRLLTELKIVAAAAVFEEGGEGIFLRLSNRRLSLVQRFSLLQNSQEREREGGEEERKGEGSSRSTRQKRKAHGMVLFWLVSCVTDR